MSAARVAAVLFDMDETLIRHTSTGLELTNSLYHTFREHLGETEEAIFARTLWQKANDLWQMMFDGALSGDVARPYAFINTLRTLRVEDTKIAHDMLATFEERLIASTQLYDDSIPVLEALRADGMRIGIVTNGYTALQTRKLEHHGLPDMVDFVLVSEAVGLHKPHPGIFQVALHKAGAKAEETLMVGDNLWADIAGAAATGIPSVLIDPEGTREPELKKNPELSPPTHVIRRLSEVLRLAGVPEAKVAGSA